MGRHFILFDPIFYKINKNKFRKCVENECEQKIQPLFYITNAQFSKNTSNDEEWFIEENTSKLTKANEFGIVPVLLMYEIIDEYMLVSIVL